MGDMGGMGHGAWTLHELGPSSAETQQSMSPSGVQLQSESLVSLIRKFGDDGGRQSRRQVGETIRPSIPGQAGAAASVHAPNEDAGYLHRTRNRCDGDSKRQYPETSCQFIYVRQPCHFGIDLNHSGAPIRPRLFLGGCSDCNLYRTGRMRQTWLSITLC